MKRIGLTKAEKQVLRMVLAWQEVCPAEYPAHLFNAAVRTLEGYGLVRGAYTEGGGVEAVKPRSTLASTLQRTRDSVLPLT